MVGGIFHCQDGLVDGNNSWTLANCRLGEPGTEDGLEEGRGKWLLLTVKFTLDE